MPPQPDNSELPRLGQISFINALPVVLPIEKGIVKLKARTVAAPPGSLNQWLFEKRLDAGAMSAFFYLENADNLELIESVAISSLGAVGSVLLFCRDNVANLSGAQIAVPDSSASSINLLRVLLKETHNIKVTLVPYQTPDFDAAEQGGVLLFGDQALTADGELSMRYNRIDLGLWWQEMTSLPMVYGVWGARKEFVETNRQAFAEIVQALGAAKDAGLSSMFTEVLDEAHKRTNLDLQRLEQYYRRNLDFSMGSAHREGLKLYERLCRKHGLINS